MKKRIIAILAFTLVMTGCSFNGADSAEETDEAIESMVAEGGDGDSKEASDVTNDSGASDNKNAVTNATSADSKDTEGTSEKTDGNAADKGDSKSSESESNVSKKPLGIYSRDVYDVLEGKEVHGIYSITFKADGTGSITLQDTNEMTWDDTKISFCDGTGYEYKYDAENDIVKLKEENWEEYNKK